MNRELDAKVGRALGDAPEYDYWVYVSPTGEAHRGLTLPVNMDPQPTLDRLNKEGELIGYKPERKTHWSRYSSDPTACEMVKAECRRRGWWYEETWDCLTKTFYAEVGGVERCQSSKSSQEEAFCLAFLAAVEAEKAHARPV